MKNLFKTLISLKTGIYTLTALSILSIIGTFLPQNREAITYITRYPIFGRLILLLGFDDMYKSAIFIGLLVLLSISTFFCIWVRFKATNRRLFNRVYKATVTEIENLKSRKEINQDLIENWEENFDKIVDKGYNTKAALKSTGYFSLAGGLLLHVGLLLIFIGGLIGLILGIDTMIHGKENSITPIPSVSALRAAKSADKLSREARYIRERNPNAPILNEYRKKVEALHKTYDEGMANPSFNIEFEKLWIDYYKSADNQIQGIKSWNSQISFAVDEKIEKSATIKVNEPISFGEYNFYQANWQKYYPSVKLQVDLINPEDKDKYGENFPKIIELTINKPVKFPWYEYNLLLMDFLPDFRYQNNRFTTATNELNNPAAYILAIDPQKGNEHKSQAWGFSPDQSAFAAHVSNMPFSFTFLSAETKYESFLTVSYDPGKPLVWIGCLLFAIGMLFCFGYGYTERWLIIKEDGTKIIAITGNRAESFFVDELKKLEEEIFLTKKEETND